jgi:hypothetical protein
MDISVQEFCNLFESSNDDARPAIMEKTACVTVDTNVTLTRLIAIAQSP